MERTLSATDTAAVGPSAAYGAPEGGPALPPRISWGAVIAGAVVAVIVGLMLNVLGVAVGASAIDVADRDTPSGTTFSVVGGLWLLAANLIGLAVGGYVAARFSGTADDTDGVLHGLSVWGIGYLLSAVLLGNIIAGTTSTAMQGASSILGGAAQGAGQAASAAAGPAAQQVDPRQLVERARTALQTGGDPARMTSEQRNAEIGTLVTRRVTAGNLAQGDRDRLNQLVAAEYGIPPEEAQRRIQQVEEQATRTAQEAERRARGAADAAATAGATAAYYAFAAMLLGAVAAVLGARLGTRNIRTVRRTA
jgi:predicted nucleic acid-binding protein